MGSVIPFRGTLYNPDTVLGDEVMAPPYDIVTSKYRDLLYQKSPHNIVRIDFGKEMPDDTENNNKYTRAKNYLERWIKEGILVRDDKPLFYAYEIDYELSSKKKTLRGILALVKIKDLGDGVYPHEDTHSKPKADRLNLMKTCMANVSPIYSMYNSPEKITSNILNSIRENPYFTVQDMDGAVHKLYKISDESKIDLIKKELRDKHIFIADGHHRYEVALEFKKEMDYVLMFLTNMADDGITICPTHRLARGIDQGAILFKLKADFNIKKISFDSDIIKTIFMGGDNAFGLYLKGEKHWYILKYKNKVLGDIHPILRELDVVVLHELVFKRIFKMPEKSLQCQRFSGTTGIAYEMDASEAISRVQKEDFSAAFFLNPTVVKDVERVALSNLRMPPKSTYFYPKLLTGMVINKW